MVGHQLGEEWLNNSAMLTEALCQNMPSTNDVWILSPILPTDTLTTSSGVLALGAKHQSFCFHSNCDPDRFSQLNQDFLNLAFPRFLGQLSPSVVHFVDPHLIGLELIWVVRNSLPNAKIIISLSDASAFCVLNGLLLKKDGQLCDGPSVAACKACKPSFDADSHFLKLNWLNSAFRLATSITTQKSRFKNVLLENEFPAYHLELVPKVDAAWHEADASSAVSSQSTKRFAYFGPVCGEGMRLISEAVRMLSGESACSVDVYPTDSHASQFNLHVDKYREHVGLFIQTSWSRADFNCYLSNYCAVLLPTGESSQALHWAESALDSGVTLIRSHRLTGLNGNNHSAAIAFLEGAAISLVAAMKKASASVERKNLVTATATGQGSNSVERLYQEVCS